MIDDRAGKGGERAVQKGVCLINDKICYPTQNIGVALGDAGKQMRGRDEDVNAIRIEEPTADDTAAVCGRDKGSTELDSVREAFGERAHLLNELRCWKKNDCSWATCCGVRLVRERRRFQLKDIQL